MALMQEWHGIGLELFSVHYQFLSSQRQMKVPDLKGEE